MNRIDSAVGAADDVVGFGEILLAIRLVIALLVVVFDP
jgi:hypothetical protein